MKRRIRCCITTLAAAALVAICTLATGVNAQPSVRGNWSPSFALPFFPIHSHLLPNGNVMMWPGDAGVSGNDPRAWNPLNQTVTSLAKPGVDLFCSGHTFLSDGSLFTAGGHIQNSVGLSQASRYDPTANTWTFFPNMNAGRWYPTTTVLGNGDVLVVSGDVDSSTGVNTLPQVLQLSSATPTFRNLTGAQLGLELYPPMLLAPNGKVFNPGPSETTRYLDTSGTGSWSVVAQRNGGWTSYGTAVMYAPGKVLVMGGGDPPANTAEVIDLNSANPTWRLVAPMQFARRHLNATLLPDGQILVTGGTSAAGFNEPSGVVYAAEIWNPSTETWTTVASGSMLRLYHSAATLLLDGRVLVTGGNGYPDAEVFSPPYLYKGARPTIAAAPSRIAYGQSFFVPTANAASVSKVTLIRLSSVTHSFNQSQYISIPSFSQATGGIDVVAPANGNVAPPGPYMLHIVDGNGVPSVGKVLLIGPTPAVDSVSPTAGFTAPTAGATVSGIVTFAASASDNVGVDRVDFIVNSAVVGSASKAPFEVNWDSRSTANGALSITARAYDVAGNAQSASVSVTVSNAAIPAPSIGLLSPSMAANGGAGFTLTVDGTNFVDGSVVRWNGVAHSTSFVSATQLTAAITADDLLVVGTAQVTVRNPDGNVSPPSGFTVSPPSSPVPNLASISPALTASGGPRLTLTVTGSNFVPGSVVLWNGHARSTAFANAGRLTAAIPAGDVAWPGTAQASVASPGSAASGSIPFSITQFGDVTPPTVTMTSPANGSIVSGIITLAVDATDNVGVTSVEYYADATLVGTAAGETLRLNWDTATWPNGAVTLSARAYDAADNYRTSPNVAVTVANGGAPDTTPPTVAMSAPANGSTVSGTVTLAATASDNIGVARVDFSVDTSLVGSATAAPFQVSWDTTGRANGNATLSAKAFDAAGNSSTSANIVATVANGGGPDTTPPTVTMSAPANGSTVSSTVTLVANATDNIGVTQVDFYVDTSLVGSATAAPFQVPWSSATRANGNVTLSARAFDAAGNYRTSPNIFVVVSNGSGPDTTPPTVTMSTPANGSTVSGTVTVAATANDNVGVTQVDFYADATLLGSATTTPYQVSWNTTTRANGNVTLSVRAFDAAGNYRTSPNIFVVVSNTAQPVPTIASLSPSSTTAGGPAFTLTVTGSNLVSGSTVRWNGAPRTTTFVSSTQLAASIAAADIASAGTAQVTVANPDGSVSNAATFTIGTPPPPPPTIASLSPSSTTAGGPAFTLTVTGSNLVSGSTVRWNGAPRTTTFVSSTQLAASIAAADIASAGTAQVTVANPDGSVSNAATFTIGTPPPPPPTIASLSPSSTTAGGPAFTLTVTGSNLVSGSTVRWNGAPRTTTFVSSTQLAASIAAADIASAGTAQVTVANPDGSVSNAVGFPISTPGFALTVSKSGPGSVTGPGISCGTDCSESYAPGSSVLLTATPSGKAVFNGWGGACASAGTAKTCALTMNATRSASARFSNK